MFPLRLSLTLPTGFLSSPVQSHCFASVSTLGLVPLHIPVPSLLPCRFLPLSPWHSYSVAPACLSLRDIFSLSLPPCLSLVLPNPRLVILILLTPAMLPLSHPPLSCLKNSCLCFVMDGKCLREEIFYRVCASIACCQGLALRSPLSVPCSSNSPSVACSRAAFSNPLAGGRNSVFRCYPERIV